jgi:hypothetical protein
LAHALGLASLDSAQLIDTNECLQNENEGKHELFDSTTQVIESTTQEVVVSIKSYTG